MPTGIRTTYTDTGAQPRSVSEMLSMIDPTEAPLLTRLGVNNESRFRMEVWPRTKYEWLEDAMSARDSTLTADINNSVTSIAVADGSLFKEGDIIEIDSELIYVSEVTSNTLSVVVRAFGGTTAASHTNTTTVSLATIARLEAADYDTGHTTTVSTLYNYTQIIAEAVKVSGSEAVDTKYGIDDTMAYHLAKLMGGSDGIGSKFKAGKLPMLLERTFFKGRRSAGSSSASRAMGGYKQFVTTNVTDLAGAALTRKHIEDLYTQCFVAGGDPTLLVCGAHVRRKISSFYEGLIATTRTETTGGSRIDTVQTDFGTLEIMFHRWCPPDEVYIFEPAKMGWLTYRPFAVYDRPTNGDYEVKEILGEYGFALMNEKAHGYLKGVSTTK